MASIGSNLVTLFFFSLLLICMHSSNARLLLLHANLIPSSTKPPHFSVSLQVLEKNGDGKTAEKARVSAETKRLLTGNAAEVNNMKIDGGVYNKEGSEMVEDHTDLVKAKHDKVHERPPNSSQHHGKEEDAGLKSDDIVVMDYQPPHRKTPIHNK